MPDISPRLRSDLVDGYLFRRRGETVELLQVRRAGSADLAPATWQPVMGHVQHDETAVDAIVREIAEETGLRRSQFLGFWQLQQVHPYFVAALDAVVLSPRFVVEAPAEWSPTLNREHDGFRFIDLTTPGWREQLAWIGQRHAVDELLEWIVLGSQDQRNRLAIPI